MDTAGSKCPENQNSTDCLLRALLNVLAQQKQAQDADIDWDPITFGFTLLIGLVASLIALATIFQAVLAGGKGGRRANSRAIGRWSKYTTRKWIFAEMSWSYTAFTPVLRLRGLEQVIEQTLRREKEEKIARSRYSLSASSVSASNWIPSRNIVLWAREKLKSFKIGVGKYAPRVAPYPATWLGLFKTTGLENFNDFTLNPITADYLPDDFIAVPASAEVGAIVAITAAAGVQRLDIGTELYPVIMGYRFQFDFRQHPVLGVIGAFSEHHRIHRVFPSPTKLERLREAVMHSQGIIELRDPYGKSLDLHEKTHDILFSNAMKHRLHMGKGSECFLLNYSHRHKYCNPIASFLLAHTPTFPPSLFPLSSLGNPFTTIALNGRFWSGVRLGDFLELRWDKWSSIIPSILLDRSSFAMFGMPESAPDEPKGEAGIHRRNMKAASPEDSHGPCLGLCLRLLDNPQDIHSTFSKIPYVERQNIRHDVSWELAHTDSWLAAFGGGEELQHRIQLLFDTSVVLSRAESMVQEGLFVLPSGVDRMPENFEQQKPSTTAQSIHCNTIQALRSLIVGFKLDRNSLKATLKIDDDIGWELDSVKYLRNHLRNKFFAGSPTQMELKITPQDEEHLGHFKRKLKESKSQIEGLVGPDYDEPRTFFNTHQMLERLATVVGCRSEPEYEDKEQQKLTRKIDDAIIYRTLLIGVLFYTALDNTKVLESGVWDRVVPII